MPDFFEVLAFWFGAPHSPQHGHRRKGWFRKSVEFDAEVRRRFLTVWNGALRGECVRWEATPLAALALVVVLDQFPRNMFRGEARAFSSDARALAVARRMLERGFDRVLSPVERSFMYLPFEHAEELAAQRRSISLFALLDAELAGHAQRHYEIVARFGRFPHRNAVLGRESTAEEREFLDQPGSSF